MSVGNMKKPVAVAFLLVFAGLSFYFFFAEDYCHVHNSLPRGTFSHADRHQTPVQTCLCFWSTLFSPGSCDFAFIQSDARLPDFTPLVIPGEPFDSDIAHPPELRSA